MITWRPVCDNVNQFIINFSHFVSRKNLPSPLFSYFILCIFISKLRNQLKDKLCFLDLLFVKNIRNAW